MYHIHGKWVEDKAARKELQRYPVRGDNVRMAIPRGKSAPNSPSAAENASANPSVNQSASVTPIPSTGTDADKTKVVVKTERPDPASVSLSPPLQSAQPVADVVPGISSPPPPTPHPAVAIPSSVNAAVPVSDDDLPSILRRLTPIQRAKLRSAAISEGVIQSGIGSGKENPDGSLSVMIRVDGDLVPQLKTWAEEANKSLDEMVRELVNMLLSSYLLSPWEAPQPITVEAPVTAK